MKIAYISYLPLADVDFSYLHEAQKVMDITCFLFVNPRHIKRSVIHIGDILKTTGIYESDVFPELGVYEGFLDLKKIKVVNVAETKHWEFSALKLMNSLVTQWRKEYDLIHMTTLPHFYEFPLFRIKEKVVLSVHDPFPHSGQSLKSKVISDSARWLYFKLFKNLLIFNDAQKKEFIEHYGLKNKNIIVSRLSSYTCLRPVAPSETTVKDDNYILFAGRITKYKGLQYLLPAFVKIHDTYPDVRLIVAGSGEFSFDDSLYRNLDYIEFRHRFIPDTELIDLIKHCKFMVCPYTDATQSGVIMSAFAFNKPVLATNVGGLPEMVEDGVFGKIVKEKDEDALVIGIDELLSESQRLQSYSDSIHREYGEGPLSWKNIAKKLSYDYKTCL